MTLNENQLVHSPNRVLAIDPGKSGAACLLGQGWLEVRRDYQTLPEIAAGITDLCGITGGPEFLVIEQVNARPGEGVCSVWAFGQSTGVAIGALCVNRPEQPIIEVHPVKWQNFFRRELVIPRPQEFDSRAICQKMFPSYPQLFKRVKDHNTADAVLIAVWALMQPPGHLQQLSQKPV